MRRPRCGPAGCRSRWSGWPVPRCSRVRPAGSAWPRPRRTGRRARSWGPWTPIGAGRAGCTRSAARRSSRDGRPRRCCCRSTSPASQKSMISRYRPAALIRPSRALHGAQPVSPPVLGDEHEHPRVAGQLEQVPDALEQLEPGPRPGLVAATGCSGMAGSAPRRNPRVPSPGFAVSAPTRSPRAVVTCPVDRKCWVRLVSTTLARPVTESSRIRSSRPRCRSRPAARARRSRRTAGRPGRCGSCTAAWPG